MQNIFVANYKEKPKEVGAMLVNLVRQWHQTAAADRQSLLDLSRSSYLVLSWNTQEQYQLHQFSLMLPNPEDLKWYFPTNKKDGEAARHINGDDADGRVFEWYGESGGQLKYYPKATAALWQSDVFVLEPLPDIEHGVLAKTASYFPDLWRSIK